MDQNETFKDWMVRYQHLLKKRHSKKQKERFLNALLIDLSRIRKDIQVVEARVGKKQPVVSRNVYVGNVKKAKTIVATYYDTPSSYFGPYHFFDVDAQRQRTLLYNIVFSVILFVIGVLFTWQVVPPVLANYSGLSWPLALIVIFYFGLLYLLGYFSKGRPNKNNLIRNTSSVLLLLQLITKTRSKNIAFAFVDNGCTNENGLQILKAKKARHAQLFYLDSVGAEADLHVFSDDLSEITENKAKHEEFVRIIAGDFSGKHWLLSKEKLQAKTLNEENMKKLLEYF